MTETERVFLQLRRIPPTSSAFSYFQHQEEIWYIDTINCHLKGWSAVKKTALDIIEHAEEHLEMLFSMFNDVESGFFHSWSSLQMAIDGVNISYFFLVLKIAECRGSGRYPA